MTATSPRFVHRGSAAHACWNGEEGRFLLRAEDTGGLFSLIELTTAPGCGPWTHVHEIQDESFVVLEGRYDIEVAGASRIVEPGGVMYIPRGTEHRFENVGKKPGRALLIVTPGGMERFFEELAELLGRPQRPAPADIFALASRHRTRGTEIGAPPRPTAPASVAPRREGEK